MSYIRPSGLYLSCVSVLYQRATAGGVTDGGCALASRLPSLENDSDPELPTQLVAAGVCHRACWLERKPCRLYLH